MLISPRPFYSNATAIVSPAAIITIITTIALFADAIASAAAATAAVVLAALPPQSLPLQLLS
jgi:hypothetical protein